MKSLIQGSSSKSKEVGAVQQSIDHTKTGTSCDSALDTSTIVKFAFVSFGIFHKQLYFLSARFTLICVAFNNDKTCLYESDNQLFCFPINLVRHIVVQQFSL